MLLKLKKVKEYEFQRDNAGITDADVFNALNKENKKLKKENKKLKKELNMFKNRKVVKFADKFKSKL